MRVEIAIGQRLLPKQKNVQPHQCFVAAAGAGAAADEHLRYEAAWHLAKHANLDVFSKLLASEDADVRLAGLIAIDVACYENFPTKKAALEAAGQGRSRIPASSIRSIAADGRPA